MTVLGRFSLSRPATVNQASLSPAVTADPVQEAVAPAESDGARSASAEQQFQRKMLDAKVRLHRRLID